MIAATNKEACSNKRWAGRNEEWYEEVAVLKEMLDASNKVVLAYASRDDNAIANFYSRAKLKEKPESSIDFNIIDDPGLPKSASKLTTSLLNVIKFFNISNFVYDEETLYRDDETSESKKPTKIFVLRRRYLSVILGQSK
jgi:hypothetical protein